MYQIIQNIRTGETVLADVPTPQSRPGSIRIHSVASLISAGTERMMIDFGRAGWFEKARQQPDKVKEVVGKIRTDGVLATAEAVRGKLDRPLALGYCNAGVVAAVDEGVAGFKPGDRVVSNGPHAEVVSVPANLCARIPDQVTFDAAVYAVPGAIALQGIRLAQPTLGEAFVVTGLGLLGQLAVQLLAANGCRVLGLDPDPNRRELAAQFGALTADPASDDVLRVAARFARGRGVDGVMITAATRSNEPVSQAARMCRKRGRIVLVGVTGLALSRTDFYQKELSFQVSCSYGPGRYDPTYEQQGHDYPVGFVRWTEQRNFEAVLDMMSKGVLDTGPLTTHRFSIGRALEGYELIRRAAPYLGIVLDYPGRVADACVADRTVELKPDAPPFGSSLMANPVVAFIGAGNYAGRVLIPAFKATGAELAWLAATSGVGPAHFGRKFDFRHASTDTGAAIDDPAVNTVVIATRHDSHAELVCRALSAGKHVFVEKPLAVTGDELDRIEAAYRAGLEGDHPCRLMVGFNRRFSPLARKMRALLAGLNETKALVVTVNAGALSADHWTQDPNIGGRRIVGEACHFIDLLRYLAGSPIVDAARRSLKRSGAAIDDISTLELSFADGSIGTIHYLANGHGTYPKERIEVFCAGRVLRLDNFRSLRGWGWPGFRGRWLWRQDKGQGQCAAAFIEAVTNPHAAPPIAFEEIMEVSRTTLTLAGDGHVRVTPS